MSIECNQAPDRASILQSDSACGAGDLHKTQTLGWKSMWRQSVSPRFARPGASVSRSVFHRPGRLDREPAGARRGLLSEGKQEAVRKSAGAGRDHQRISDRAPSCAGKFSGKEPNQTGIKLDKRRGRDGRAGNPLRAASVEAEAARAEQRNLLPGDGLTLAETYTYEPLSAGERKPIEELVEISGLNSSEVLATLLDLAGKGIIRE